MPGSDMVPQLLDCCTKTWMCFDGLVEDLRLRRDLRRTQMRGHVQAERWEIRSICSIRYHHAPSNVCTKTDTHSSR